MRKIIVSEFITIDGVMEDPGGAEGTKFGGWSMKYASEAYGKYKNDELFAGDTLLLGRVTYEEFAKSWPKYGEQAEGKNEFANRMNDLPKYVVSDSLENPTWKNTRVIKGEGMLGEIRKLKEQPGQDILIAGSAQLVNSLMEVDLIDEYRLMVHPVVLGEGKRLFTEGHGMHEFELVSTTPLGSNVIVLTYKPANTKPTNKE